MMAIDKRIEVCDKSGSKEQYKSIPWAEPDNKAISLFDSYCYYFIFVRF
jgi:hypothetical protein